MPVNGRAGGLVDFSDGDQRWFGGRHCNVQFEVHVLVYPSEVREGKKELGSCHVTFGVGGAP